MKKVLLAAAVLVAGVSFGQEMTSKKGTPILPEAGDYAIGFDAANVVDYAGNLFNGNAGNSAGNLGDLRANTIYGKMFKDANTAYRGMLRIGFGSTTNRTTVADNNDPTKQVENEVKNGGMNITLGGGIEMRRGKGRLQGVYGPTAWITLGSAKTENTFGNAITTEAAGTSRTTENKAGGSFGITVGAFGGVEYFFAPKMSVGAEVMWGIGFNSVGNGEMTTESWDGATTTTTTTETGGSSSFAIDVTPNSMISLNFHF